MVNATDCRSVSWGFDSLPLLAFLKSSPPSSTSKDCRGGIGDPCVNKPPRRKKVGRARVERWGGQGAPLGRRVAELADSVSAPI